MARIQQVIDDMTGAHLSEEVEPTTVTIDGTDYTVDLGSANKEHLVRWLSGEGAYAVKSEAPAAAPEREKTPEKEKATRTRLTGDAKATFDKDVAEFNEAKQEQRVKMFEWAATTDEHGDVKDSGKNIKAALVEGFYAAHPTETHYYGANKVEPPKNTDYA